MRAVELIIDALRVIVRGVQRWPVALVDGVPLFKEGDRHSARKRILVLSLLTAAASVGCAERAPAGINCEKLRSLRAGMPIDQVRSLLGTPPLDYQQDGHTVFSAKQTDRLWGWPGPGVKLYIEFGQARLIKADSWIRTMWRDLFDNESRPTLFTLKEDGTVHEGQDFKRIYCP